tara:strand:+ start:475 stop:747 length:273 start_codon:yes stop_codon:yes gene_type:complete
MEPEVMIRYVALIIAALILVSNVDFISKIQYIKSLIPKRTPKIPEDNTVSVNFLEIVDLWHQLKESCDSYGLKEATNKLDEVFPLLNAEE